MERLTEKHYKKPGHYMKCSENCVSELLCEECPDFEEIIDRLAAYEDTGLTPEQIVAMKAELEAERYRHDRVQDFCAKVCDQLDEARGISYASDC